MTVSIPVQFDFHDVGQGLFYSGDVGGFNFVYDCGSFKRNYIEDAVESYKDMLNKKPVHLLVISHFHQDHVSGLDSLLKNLAVGDVVIPYFTPLERLIMALKREIFPDWYYNFLMDPVPFLFERGVKRVIVVGGEKGDSGFPPSKTPPYPPKNLDEIKQYKEDITEVSDESMNTIVDISGMPESNTLKDLIEKNDKNWIEYKNFHIKDHSGNVNAFFWWVFRFFNYKVGKGKLDQFKICLKRQKVSPLDPASLKSAITNTVIRERIRDCYKKISNRDLNDTSLAVYHGPLGQNESDFCVDCGEGLSFNYKCQHYKPLLSRDKCNHFCGTQIGQLLTGDIGLKRGKYREFKRHYDNYLDTVSITQIPHRGSKNNWREQVVHDVKNCKHWVSSSGYPSFYSHPHTVVALDVLRNFRCFCWNNQHNKFSVEGTVTW
ncbi:MAG: MBL fold metallo-hydrolase [Theionarchaea archaeon]|nr:MBL fold metallo-hydrolase [Theionarchaea archaeon]